MSDERVESWNFSVQDSHAPRAVGDIFAVGRNYTDHIREMGGSHDVGIVLFLKARASLAADDQTLVIPSWTNDLQFEGELVALIGRRGRDISVECAIEHVWGYAAGIDWTLRDLQHGARRRGEPWFPGKNFAGAAAIGPFRPRSAIRELGACTLRVSVNGEVRQEARLSEMRRSVAEIVAHISSVLPIAPGDAVFTGTPAGVGRVQSGDVVRCEIEGVGSVTTHVAASAASGAEGLEEAEETAGGDGR
jgi:2-keto-4-pentenoate hydratase/2-oxohepta-3-ene-1,7-dioic acid hydratase in catechol pathway